MIGASAEVTHFPVISRVPDAYEPAISWGLKAAELGRVAQRQRRAKILAATRSLLAEHGFDGVTVRMVSLRTGISPQTIHNLVGPRHEMIASAVCEHIETMVRFARNTWPQGSFLLALALSFGMSAGRNADYIKESTKTYFPPDQPLHDSIRATGYQLILKGLQEMKASGQIRPECDLGILARRVASLTNGIMLEWITGAFDDEDLIDELVQGYMPLLQFVLSPDGFEATRIAAGKWPTVVAALR